MVVARLKLDSSLTVVSYKHSGSDHVQLLVNDIKIANPGGFAT